MKAWESKTHYCSRCREQVAPVMGKFMHPQLGEKTANLCPHCGTLVYPKKEEN